MNGALTAQKFLSRRRQFATREKNWTGRGIRQGFVEELTCTQWRRIGDHIPSQTIFSSKIADLTLVVSLCLTLATDGRIDTTSTIIYILLSYNTPWRSLKVLTYLVRNYTIQIVIVVNSEKFYWEYQWLSAELNWLSFARRTADTAEKKSGIVIQFSLWSSLKSNHHAEFRRIVGLRPVLGRRLWQWVNRR